MAAAFPRRYLNAAKYTVSKRSSKKQNCKNICNNLPFLILPSLTANLMTCTPQNEPGNIAIHVKNIPTNKKIGAANIIAPLLAMRNIKAKNVIDRKLTTKKPQNTTTQ